MPVAPALDLMAEVYRLDSRGGAGSVRFRRYTSLCETHPVHLYNPMTSKPEALETVVRLIELDAEQIVGRLVGERGISLAVLTPGAWTDRLFTDIEHRTKALPFVGFWAGESVDPETIVSATTQQLVRLDWQRRPGSAESVASLTAQEGLALRAAGVSPVGDVELAGSVYPIIHREMDHGTLIALDPRRRRGRSTWAPRARTGGWLGLLPLVGRPTRQSRRSDPLRPRAGRMSPDAGLPLRLDLFEDGVDQFLPGCAVRVELT